jgi:hypothetical protein
MGWYQTHRQAFSKALLAAHGPACYGQLYPCKSSSNQLNHLYTERHGGARDCGGRGRRGEKRYRESPEPLGCEEEVEDDSDLEEGEMQTAAIVCASVNRQLRWAVVASKSQ